jgi:hypothetical protein
MQEGRRPDDAYADRHHESLTPPRRARVQTIGQNALEQTRAGARPLTDRSLDHRTVRRETNEGNDMTRDLQGEMITALENYRNAFENGTLNLEIVRTLIAAIIATR